MPRKEEEGDDGRRREDDPENDEDRPRAKVDDPLLDVAVVLHAESLTHGPDGDRVR